MDANQQRFWLLADADDWPEMDLGAEYDLECRRLRLRDTPSERKLVSDPDPIEANKLEKTPSIARDAFGTTAYWDADEEAVFAQGALGKDAPPRKLFTPDANEKVVDLALGYDDVLYIAVQKPDGIRLLDRRDRWQEPLKISLDKFAPDCLAADPAEGVWALDRTERTIARLTGLPLPDGQPGSFAKTTFRPVPENPTPPTLAPDPNQPKWVDDDEKAVAIACGPAGLVAVLSRRLNEAQKYDESWLHVRELDGRWRDPVKLGNVGRCYSITWLSASRIAVLPVPRKDQAVKLREFPAFDPADTTAVLKQVGEIYPRIDAIHGPFLQGVTLPPHYLTEKEKETDPPNSRPVVALSARHFKADATVQGRTFDSGREGVIWHRLYLEAVIPPCSGIVVSLFASDDPVPKDKDLPWDEHHFGSTPEWTGAGQNAFTHKPPAWFAPARGVWLEDRSEIPHHAGLLGCRPERDRCGLFTALVQRPGRAVRALTGRYLQVRVRLLGPGYTTPQLAALRVYGSRFSYRDNYLPELYREELFGDDAKKWARATPSDFLDRFLGLFESVLTPLEDRVANAHVVMDPRSTPDDALEWLGSWMGVTLDSTFPLARRRAWIGAAHRLYQTRGTLAGLQLALEIATGGQLVREFHDADGWESPDPDVRRKFAGGREAEFPRGGGVTTGCVLVIEEFRLRRVFATILGANLSEPDDPLLPGLIFSTNSYVGKTLILGDEEKKEFLALFRNAFSDDPAERKAEQAAVFDLYYRLAHRVTILVQDTVSATDLGIIRRVAESESPAHVQLTVVQASRKLIIGISSLVEIDTYLTPPPERGVARVGYSHLGEGDFIRRLPALDPRLGRGEPASNP